MLAEPRRRQKYSINPRGLDWSNGNTYTAGRIAVSKSIIQRV